ncbi:hypothetical protein V495_07835 [Pseudogymnoascus sp. VKM F-4514 (FW-929)]|nr:hypothetical protein V495_07835 [Pseudogymnoascus sp. VKM F-4514 (FW-929)]KFY58425.1 hypothetical protein V497_04832 [Pseudogymnoascus sp. VKM F-4516 (FW-969)]
MWKVTGQEVTARHRLVFAPRRASDVEVRLESSEALSDIPQTRIFNLPSERKLQSLCDFNRSSYVKSAPIQSADIHSTGFPRTAPIPKNPASKLSTKGVEAAPQFGAASGTKLYIWRTPTKHYAVDDSTAAARLPTHLHNRGESKILKAYHVLSAYDGEGNSAMPTTNVSSSCGQQLQEIADALSKSKKVVVITGAGISTNCGIPDFRSENGLYTLIQAQYDAAAAIKSNANSSDIDDRPVKRRKLDRSCSLGSSELENGLIKEVPLRRQLRSSLSFHSSTTNSDLATVPVSNPDTPSNTPNDEAETAISKDVAPEAPNEPIFSSQASARSSGSRQSLPNMKGKDLFDSIIWTDKLTTSIFYTFISSLRQKILKDVKSTTDTHKFIRALRDGGRLVRNYTQNIDMLEAREGLCTELSRGTGTRGRFNPKHRKEVRTGNDKEGGSHDSGVEVVHLHGSLDSLRCGLCARLANWEDEDRHVTTLAGEAPECPWCSENSAKREGKGRRSLAVGRLRPDIVLYGEEHPSAHLVGPLITHDLSLNPDMLLILGTSMRVHGLKVMVREFAKAVHGRGGSVVFVNQTKPPDSIWGDVIDYWVEWDCDAWVTDLKERRDDIWLPQGMKVETPKDDKPQVPAKNPTATRPDHNNGAHLTWKILASLRELTGRGEDKESAKRIERINGMFKPPKAAPRRSLPSTNKKQTARTPLSNLSSNVQGLGKQPGKGKSKPAPGKRDTLPSPPTSDDAGPRWDVTLPAPMTPRTKRIKYLSSLGAILANPNGMPSSPLSSPPPESIWSGSPFMT